MKKKLLLMVAMIAVLVCLFAISVSAETITVADDGTTDIVLGDCVIEGLDREIPAPSSGFTFVLDTDLKTAKITKWADYADKEKGVNFVVPSTVTYDGNTYTVISFNDVIGYTDNGVGKTNDRNFILVKVFLPDTLISIPSSAFQNCAALEYVYIGSGLETWGENAFNFAGATAGGYYVQVEKETTNEETGEVTTTTENVRIEDAGGTMGNIKEFVLKSKKITTMSKYVFHHTEFDKNAIIEMDITQFTKFESYCISLNQYALTDNHKFEGTPLRFEVFDIRNATEIANDAFYYAGGGNIMIVNADQTKYFNLDKLKSIGAGYYSENDNDGYFIICGGETPETAQTLTGPIWTTNAQYWHGSTVNMYVFIHGYVNAYDGVEGLATQNGYGIDQIDYFFDSEDSFNYYINSIESTTSKVDTYTRYAKNSKGYFNVCTLTEVDGELTHAFKAYNLKYTAATEETEAVVEIVEATKIPTILTNVAIKDGKCTESEMCFSCEFEFVAGLDHVLENAIFYNNGFLMAGYISATCQNEGCQHSVKIEDTEPLFVMNGYSHASAPTGAIMQSFQINKDAIEKYKTLSGKDVKYGILAASGNVANIYKGVFTDNVVSVDFTNRSYDIMEMKIYGIGESHYETELYCCGYIIVDGAITYLDDGMESGATMPTKVTYNSLTNEVVIPSTPETTVPNDEE